MLFQKRMRTKFDIYVFHKLGWCVCKAVGWPLRNIHMANDNEPFTFYVDVFLPISLPIPLTNLTVYISNAVGVL